jgi:glycerol uptake facilitator-like aquaporin
MFSNTFAGIAPSSAPAFIGMQLIGAAGGLLAVLVLYPDAASAADDVLVPHTETATAPRR